MGKTITVMASYSDVLGGVENPVSAATAAVTSVNDPGSVSITGSATQGQTLTATVSDPDGVPATIVYQWKADGAIVGANSNTYVLTQVEVGKTIHFSMDQNEVGDYVIDTIHLVDPPAAADEGGDDGVGKDDDDDRESGRD